MKDKSFFCPPPLFIHSRHVPPISDLAVTGHHQVAGPTPAESKAYVQVVSYPTPAGIHNRPLPH